MNIFQFNSPLAINKSLMQTLSNIGYATTTKEISSPSDQDECPYSIICTPSLYPDTLQRIQQTLQDYPEIDFLSTTHTIQNLNLNPKWYRRLSQLSN